MKKSLYIIQNVFILTLILVVILGFIIFIYKVIHEKVDTSYLWNIQFSDLKVKEGSQKNKSDHKENTTDLEVTLKKEGEFYEAIMDIVNKGNLNAKIVKLKKNVTSTNDILKAQITYDDGKEIKKGDILKSGETKKVKIRIDYPQQKEKIYDELTLNFSLEINYKPVY